MQRLFKTQHASPQACKNLCEKSDLWEALKYWVIVKDTIEFPEYVARLREFNMSNTRLDAFARLNAKDDNLALLWKINVFIANELKVTNVWEKAPLWLKIVNELNQFEAMVSVSLLKAALKEAVGVDAQKKILQDPLMTYCLDQEGFDKLKEKYPQLMDEVLAEKNPAYTFVTPEMRADRMESAELEKFRKISM